jgi:hypothetical protein
MSSGPPPRVQLKGNDLDLENLCVALRDGPHRVTSEGEMYWLRSDTFDEFIADPDLLRDQAAKLLPLVNAVGKAHINGFEPVELGVCVDWVRADGRWKRRLTETIDIRVRSGHRLDADDPSQLLDARLAGWLEASNNNVVAREVVELWGGARQHDWVMLYRIFEKVESGRPSIPSAWASRAEISRFKHTANSPAVLGGAARHGTQSADPPKRPMALDDAEHLIERFIVNWMEELRSSHGLHPLSE